MCAWVNFSTMYAIFIVIFIKSSPSLGLDPGPTCAAAATLRFHADDQAPASLRFLEYL